MALENEKLKQTQFLKKKTCFIVEIFNSEVPKFQKQMEEKRKIIPSIFKENGGFVGVGYREMETQLSSCQRFTNGLRK